MASCSTEEKKTGTETAAQPAAKPAVKEAQYDTGRTAFQRMYVAARAWAPDAKPFRLHRNSRLMRRPVRVKQVCGAHRLLLHRSG